MNERPLAKPEWIEAALRRFEGPLFRFARGITGDAEAARDVVQDTFLKLCRQDRAELDSRLAEWLFTVCRNRALDVLRKEKRMTRLSEDQMELRASADPGPHDLVEHAESAAKVLHLLEGLPPGQREVIRLKFQNGFSYREISRISGHSVTNVGYLIHTGLKSIRTQLSDRHPAGARPCEEARQ